jgi:CRISPR system Cascade subunit CasE
MRALALPQVLHGAVESGLPRSTDGSRERTLWRVDYLKEMCYLLVISTQWPDFTQIAEQFGYPYAERPWETKDYNQLLARLQSGQVWRFRLRANPIHSSFQEKDETSGRGKVFAHVTQEQQRQWLLARADACGFILRENTFDIVHTEWKRFQKAKENGHQVTLSMAAFEGVLTVSDPERFRQSLVSGIGRAKAYGCGLLTIARYGGDPDA